MSPHGVISLASTLILQAISLLEQPNSNLAPISLMQKTKRYLFNILGLMNKIVDVPR